jgi:diguanylate cyclase (GGDEF)-like protein
MIALPKNARWSLKAKFALCSGALMFAFSVAFTTWTLRSVQTDLRSSIVDAQRALLRSTARDIDAKVELRRDALATIAALLSQAAPSQGPQMDAFFAPRPVLRKIFDAVLVVDAMGRVVYDSQHRAVLAENDVAVRPYFKTLVAGAGPLISAPMRPIAGGEPFIVFAAPLHAPDGKFSGALVCTLNLQRDNFLGELSQVRIGRRGYQFNEVLPLAVARCGRSGLAMALMFLDVDHFKEVNDKLGHAAGDTILKEFARRLQENMRSTDTVARLGGDEFVVILEGLRNDEEPQLVARKILAGNDRPFEVHGRPLKVTTSVGIAFHASGAEGAADLLARADAALYQAKAAGRNTYRLSTA